MFWLRNKKINFQLCSLIQGLFSGEIVRDLLIFMPKFLLKFAKWEKKPHTKMKIPQKILLKFLAEN